MSARKRREKLEQQRVYQDAYRETQTKRARPSRDDVARMLLYRVVTGAWDHEGLLEEVADHLVEQGFDGRETERFVDDLVERYQRGWGFRRKLHLERGLQHDTFDAGEH